MCVCLLPFVFKARGAFVSLPEFLDFFANPLRE